MNALARILPRPKARATIFAGEVPDYDDKDSMDPELWLSLREAHRRRLALRFSPGTVRAQEHGGKPRVRIRV